MVGLHLLKESFLVIFVISIYTLRIIDITKENTINLDRAFLLNVGT